ncbi:MAG TPA: TlpA disulfide reductase family protein [Candidatus Solibacter sp.]|nr:TlpA disulfide reductase family protein [Candidatus Solibacter sp.]
MTPARSRILTPAIPAALVIFLSAFLARAQSPAPPRTLEVLDSGHYLAKVAEQHGKPLMVTFWATWCEPCRDEYPMVNELVRQYQPKGLAVFGVSLDDDAEESLALHFLARVDPVFPNYRKKPGKEDEFINRVSPKWSGALPATFFYDPEGHLIGQLTGEQKREAFIAAIEKTLASAPQK